MNYLALCQQTAQECNVSSTLPASVVSQTGMIGNIVSWVNQAYEDIQRMKMDWSFRQASKTFNTTPSSGEYLAQVSDVEKIDVEKMSCYLTSTGVANQDLLQYISFDEFYPIYLVGSQTDARPEYFCIGHDGAIIFGPVPDADYTIKFYYTQTIQSMSANTDEPIIPEDYHEAIIWKACMYYAGHQEAFDFLKVATVNFNSIIHELKVNRSTPMTLDSRALV